MFQNLDYYHKKQKSKPSIRSKKLKEGDRLIQKESADLEEYFKKFRENIVGINSSYISPYGRKKIIYADWIASGRLYGPIEDKIKNEIGPFIANTHTETSELGTMMTHAYHKAQKIIKTHVNANSTDAIITSGFGMTSVINKFQRILCLRDCSGIEKTLNKSDKNEGPVVFISHMEHHSNHTSWYETIADVVQIEPDNNLFFSLENLETELKKYKNRKLIIGSFTACSNVTGIHTPYHEMAKLIHKYGGYIFVDFAASAPYMNINMHPKDIDARLDAVMFSPHKFLGGPGSSGVLVFNKELYNREVPVDPGGGTVDWTNPWGNYKFIDDIEIREDGGTPGFIQAMRIALSIDLKNKMGVEKIMEREEELVKQTLNGLSKIRSIHILADNNKNRLGAISFYSDEIHYNLFVKLLSDRYGIQVRGGCACAGTYGHYLLEVSYDNSQAITEKINNGDFSAKPGWVRLSLHPTMTNEEIDSILKAIEEIVANHKEWQNDYSYNSKVNEFYHKSFVRDDKQIIDLLTL